MDYILDTHVLLWSIFETNRLSQSAQQILMNRESRRFVSISSMWEIAIKNRIGKITADVNIQKYDVPCIW